MIEIVVLSETVQVVVPEAIRAEACLHLRDIWRNEYAGSSTFVMEITEPVKAFVEKVKLDRNNILVYR